MSKFRENHPYCAALINLVLQFVIALVLLYFWVGGMFAVSFGLVHRGVPMLCFTVFCLGLLLCSVGVLWRFRMVRRISYLMLLAAVLGGFGHWFHYWWTEGRFPILAQKVNWLDYQPFAEGNKLVKVEIPKEYQLDVNDLPRMDGAYALYPIYAALTQAMYPKELATQFQYLDKNGSDVIYSRLLDGGCDLIFALEPSKQQQEEAEAKGLTYEMTPICSDAFVFYVNAQNPVSGLSTADIKGIYSGQISDWHQIDKALDGKIIAFQRNEGSGSQTTLQRLMGDTPIMPPLREDRVGGMGDIINDTANYRNYRAALGFSFRYYSTELLKNKKIKLLPIDGVAPTVENISSGVYPHVATVFAVTVRPRSENIRKIVDFLLTPAGQELVEKTGYVPMHGKVSQSEK